MKAICHKGAEFIYTDEAVFSPDRTIILKHHKPDYAFDTLCSCNYISRFTVFSKKLTDAAGMFRSEFDGSHDYDLILRYTDAASHVCHISKLLYFRRSHDRANEPRFNNEPYAVWSAEKAIGEYLKKRGFAAKVEKKFGFPGFYRVNYTLTEKPMVSIIIPNKDNISLLRNCLSSIIEKTSYENYEIIIVENNSTKEATFAYYEELKRYPGISVVNWVGKGFNYSELCNFGARHATGTQLLFMNNDVEIITPNWIEEMLMYSQRKDVGVVGMKLYFLNGSVQHAGVVLGMGGIASHVYLGMPYTEMGFMAKLHIVQNMSAVTAACMLMRKSVFEEVGLFAPEFCSSYNDIDLCLKARKAGYLIVWTPYAEAYHLESKSRGYSTTSGQKRKLSQETALFKAKWKEVLAQGDPYYNRNFSIEKADYSVK
jgi:GT2 family glycosyltransferase